MTEQERERVAELLKQSVPSIEREPRRDLWPDMLSRLDEHPASKPWFAALFAHADLAAVPWFDWVLLAALIVGVCFYPKSIPIWLYHF